MEQNVLIFGEQCFNKNTLHKNKIPFSINKVDDIRMVLSRKGLYGKKGSFKFFIGYIIETNAFPIPLYIKLLQMNGYIKYFNDNKYVNILFHDKKLLKNTMQY